MIGDCQTFNKIDLSSLNRYLNGINPHLIFGLTGDISNSNIKCHSHNDTVSCIPVDGYIFVTSGSEAITLVTATYQTLLEIRGAIHSPLGINVDKKEFCNTLLGPLRDGHSRILACTTEARHPRRAIKAIRIPLESTEFLVWLNQTDGLVVKISGGYSNLMGHEIKEIMAELNQHIPDRCKCVCSISHNRTLPKDGIKVTLFAARWS